MTRAQFRTAIMAGIDAANVPAEPAVRLIRLAETATVVGANFSDGPGCPLVQAGIVTPAQANLLPHAREKNGWPEWADRFTDTYDHALPRDSFGTLWEPTSVEVIV